MIIDSLDYANKYKGLDPLIEKGLDYLMNTDFSEQPIGKFPIQGSDLFAIISEYDTKPEEEARSESHRKYIDIQYVFSGEEQMGYVILNDQTPEIPYNEEKDVMFYRCETVKFTVKEGFFAIFFPHDIHQPCIQAGKPGRVKKIVVKVKVS